jgi:hypothetical protein
MMATGTGARKERSGDAQSREGGEQDGETELLVWNGLVTKAVRATAPCVPELEQDRRAGTKSGAGTPARRGGSTSRSPETAASQ